MTTPQTPAALRRKVERLEAQLAALREFMQTNAASEYNTIRKNADMAVRIMQAARILQGEDE